MNLKPENITEDSSCREKGMEDRTGMRRRMIKRGVVSVNNGAETHYCAVRDFTKNGARLKFEGPVMLPECFWLYIEIDGLKVESQTKWRKGLEIGIEFLSEPIPIMAKRSQVVSSVA